MRGRTFLARCWEERTPGYANLLLFPLSFLYEMAVRIRNYLYDRGHLPTYRLPCPVISIGNLTVGGTGKTPLTVMVARIVKEAGYLPAIISRGYKGKGEKGVNIVAAEEEILLPPSVAGDEPALMASKLRGIPVLTGHDRVKVGEIAVKTFSPDCLICDDTFQHRRLHRDLDILLIRAKHPFGNGRLLPAGPLREPKEAMNRANVIIFTLKGEEPFPTFTDLPTPNFIARLEAKDLFIPSTGESRPLSFLAGKRVCAFAGIAEPASFARTLREQGAEPVSFLPFPDHYPYTTKDMKKIEAIAEEARADIICTTEKDAVRISDFPHFVLRTEMKIRKGKDRFTELILSTIRTWKRYH